MFKICVYDSKVVYVLNELYIKVTVVSSASVDHRARLDAGPSHN